MPALLPPTEARIPKPPEGFLPTNGSDFRGVQPKKSEQAALPAAISDIQAFVEYASRLGAAAPPRAHLLKLLAAGSQWTTMRNQTAAWDAFCVTQEGIAWTRIRSVMDSLKAAFHLAVTADPTLASAMPGLASFLGAKKAIAQRALSTRRANNKDALQGKLPTHGVVGKKRKRSAERAALEAGASAGGAGSAVPAAPAANGAPAAEVVPVGKEGAAAGSK